MSDVWAEAFERFKWNVLGDAAFEDIQGLWEPLWGLRGGEAIEGLSDAERQRWAERALRELYDAGHIYFFEVPLHVGLNAAADDEHLRLDPEQVEETLQAEWWRGPDGLPPQHPDVWFGATSAGERACNNPPEHIRKLWRPNERRWPEDFPPAPQRRPSTG